MITLASLTLGLHLGSAHVPDRPQQNNSNVRVYVRTQGGWTAGVYRNTLGRTSTYIGHTQELGAGFALTLGAVHGYEKRCGRVERYKPRSNDTYLHTYCDDGANSKVAPLIVPSYRLPYAVLGATPRLSVAPSKYTAIHLSVEWSL